MYLPSNDTEPRLFQCPDGAQRIDSACRRRSQDRARRNHSNQLPDGSSSADFSSDASDAASTTDFNFANPFSNSPPSILSMFMNRQTALLTKFFSPKMLQVTIV